MKKVLTFVLVLAILTSLCTVSFANAELKPVEVLNETFDYDDEDQESAYAALCEEFEITSSGDYPFGQEAVGFHYIGIEDGALRLNTFFGMRPIESPEGAFEVSFKLKSTGTEFRKDGFFFNMLTSPVDSVSDMKEPALRTNFTSPTGKSGIGLFVLGSTISLVAISYDEDKCASDFWTLIANIDAGADFTADFQTIKATYDGESKVEYYVNDTKIAVCELSDEAEITPDVDSYTCFRTVKCTVVATGQTATVADKCAIDKNGTFFIAKRPYNASTQWVDDLVFTVYEEEQQPTTPPTEEPGENDNPGATDAQGGDNGETSTKVTTTNKLDIGKVVLVVGCVVVVAAAAIVIVIILKKKKK